MIWQNSHRGRFLNPKVVRSSIVVLGLLVCVYALSVLAYVRSIPDLGLQFGFHPEIQHSDKTAFHAGDGDLPEPKDTVTRIGKDPIKNWGQLVRCLAELSDQSWVRINEWSEARPDQAPYIEIGGTRWVWISYSRTDGSESSAWAMVRQAPIDALLPSIVWFFLKAGLFGIGAIILWKRPEDRTARQFFLLCMVTCNAYMGGYHWQRIATQQVLLLVFMTSAVLLPAFSLHFYLIFPRPKKLILEKPFQVLLFIYGVPAAFLLALAWNYFRVRFEGLGEADRPLQNILFISNWYFGVAALWFLGCVVALGCSYVTAANIIERNQVKCIFFGAVAALVPIGYTLYLAFLEQDSFSAGAMWPMFAASVCLNVAYAVSITRYRLMQIDQFISSGVIYFSISFLAGLVYYGLVFVGVWIVGSRVVEMPLLGQALGVSTTALVLMIVLDLIRGRFRKILDSRYRREKYGLDRTLRKMSQAIEQLVDPPALAKRLLQGSAELIGATSGQVYLRQGDPPLYKLVDALGETPEIGELAGNSPLVEALPICGTLAAHSRPLPVAEMAHRQMRTLNGEVAHALIHEGQLIGILILGPKEEGFHSADDLNVVAAIAHMTTLALASAEGHRIIDGLNRDMRSKVAKIAEQQRRIANLQNQLLSQARTRVEEKESRKKGPVLEMPLESSEAPQDKPESTQELIGSSASVRELLHYSKKVAASSSAVLLRGESGTGKEVLARFLHGVSPRAEKPFVKVHCAALSPTLLESELFGHVKGAFTGAHKDKVGRFEMADGGTLFLDEIGDISLDIQTKLLRVIQENTFERVGSSEAMQVDVRLLSATHQNLEKLIREGKFREDLYYRLNVISIEVPPLRRRGDDVIELALHFLKHYGARCAKSDLQIDDEALLVLREYSWPGNIRQLENVMERAVVIAEGPSITADDLPDEIVHPTPPEASSWNGSEEPGEELSDARNEYRTGGSLRSRRESAERDKLIRALAEANGNKAEAARSLGLARSTFFSRLRKHGLG